MWLPRRYRNINVEEKNRKIQWRRQAVAGVSLDSLEARAEKRKLSAA